MISQDQTTLRNKAARQVENEQSFDLQGFESCCVFQTVDVFGPTSRCDLHRLWQDEDLYGPEERHMRMMMRRGLFTLLEELWKEHIVPGVCGPESQIVFVSRLLQSNLAHFH